MNSIGVGLLKWIFVFCLFSFSVGAQTQDQNKDIQNLSSDTVDDSKKCDKSNNIVYKVTHVADGDTFDATDGNIIFRVRMAGIDAPEKKQPYGQMATLKLKELILDKEVAIQRIGSGRDAFNRVLGQVLIDQKDIGLEMIETGLATYYRPDCTEYPLNKKKYDYDPRPYVEAEERAKLAAKNFWSSKNLLPCQFRKEKK